MQRRLRLKAITKRDGDRDWYAALLPLDKDYPGKWML